MKWYKKKFNEKSREYARKFSIIGIIGSTICLLVLLEIIPFAVMILTPQLLILEYYYFFKWIKSLEVKS